MATTLSALATGSLSYKWVATIEGYPYALTDATSAAVATAYAGTDYAAALPALYVDLQNEQTLDPWAPFTNGGRLTLRVVDTLDDTFGIDTSRKAGTETFLDADLDCDDTTATLVSNAAFAASGTVYCGTEAIAYTAKGGATLTGLTRGKYSPFLTDGGANFAHPHSIPTDPLGFTVPPVVSVQPRHWVGRWVALRMHLWDAANSTLNTRDDSRLVFAGRIQGLRDNPDMTTDVDVEHISDVVERAVLGAELWTATIADGIWLIADQEWTIADFDISAATTGSSTFTVVSGAPADAFEVQEGRYTLFEIIEKMNAWLSAAKTSSAILGTYKFSLTGMAWGVTRGRIRYTLTGGGSDCGFFMTFPNQVMRALGMLPGAELQNGPFTDYGISRSNKTAATLYSEVSTGLALRTIGEAAELIDESGTFYDQTDTLPSGLVDLFGPTPYAGGSELGFCLLNGTQPCAVIKDGSNLTRITQFSATSGLQTDAPAFEIPFDDPGGATLQQYIHVVDTLANQFKKIFYSTGTAGFNHATYDAYPAALGLAIPGEMLGDAFEASCDELPSADVVTPIIITKPVKLADLLAGDLKLRFAFLRWANEHLEFWSWMTPITGLALEESNKAHPAGVDDEQRCSTQEDDSWQRNVIKIEFNRDFTISDSSSAFKGHRTVVDRVAIDDNGGTQRIETIRAQNTYNQAFVGSGGQGVEELLPRFLAIAPFFTRPVRKTRRTIDPRYWEQISVGDVVLVGDEFARDPSTGQRGVSARPGIAVSHRYNPGGLDPGASEPRDMDGEVEIMFLDQLSNGPYVPSANIDHTQANAGYNAGTFVLTCEAHAYSESGLFAEAADASYMSAGRKVRIVERDPDDPAAPLSWDRIVASQTGNTVTLTAGLALPAWDATKKYRMIWDDWGDTITNQQTFTYQADDADGTVADSRIPFQYTIGTGKQSWPPNPLTENAAGDAVELPPNSSFGDGVGLDVGTQVALNRLANNLMDYKTAKSTPLVFDAPLEFYSEPSSSSWLLAYVMPYFLTADGLSASINRSLFIRPVMKSLDGTPAVLRVTLGRLLPSGATCTDVERLSLYDSVEFTTSSLTYVQLALDSIPIGKIKDANGRAFLLIEIKEEVSCSALELYEGPRET